MTNFSVNRFSSDLDLLIRLWRTLLHFDSRHPILIFAEFCPSSLQAQDLPNWTNVLQLEMTSVIPQIWSYFVVDARTSSFPLTKRRTALSVILAGQNYARQKLFRPKWLGLQIWKMAPHSHSELTACTVEENAHSLCSREILSLHHISWCGECNECVSEHVSYWLLMRAKTGLRSSE